MRRHHIALLSSFTIVMLLLAGCTGSGPRPGGTGDNLADLAGVDLTALDARAYEAARLRICAVTGLACEVETAQEKGPRAVLARASSGVLVICGADKTWELAAVGEDGRLQWQTRIDLGRSVTPAAWSIDRQSELGFDTLTCSLDGDHRLSALIWALGDQRAYLVRARDTAGRPALGRISQMHPDLEIVGGRIDSQDPRAVLAELVRLCQPAAKEDRHRSSIRGTIEEMASGTERWVAEAAAQVLVQP